MPHVSLRVTEEEKDIMESYAAVHKINITDAIKKTFFQMIEDEYDLQAIKKYRIEKAKGNVKLYTHDEVKKELGLV
ncbi:MAG: DUF6290 family protein [Defluviitaleaceae bacterium]|nr:DUF6290 family protein [Defluviitaleaceae bacterium]